MRGGAFVCTIIERYAARVVACAGLLSVVSPDCRQDDAPLPTFPDMLLILRLRTPDAESIYTSGMRRDGIIYAIKRGSS